MSQSIKRLLKLPNRSFFLFGPRLVGKSFWLNEQLADAPHFDLLNSSTYLELSKNPSILEAKLGNLPKNSWICIDEVQKVPSILSEVHRLIEKKGYRFALSGSSARKLKRGNADLLAGRAITCMMEGFSFAEIQDSFDLETVLNWGTLPLVYFAETEALKAQILSAYVHTYIKEEIQQEGIVRNIEQFVRFLEVAGLVNAQIINKENIARDAKIARSTVDVYFSILQDTLLAHTLPAYRANIKVREQAHPKFYWFDVGVARGASGMLHDPLDKMQLGWALETLIFHELRVYNHISGKNRPIYYYRTASGAEIDFVIETRRKTQTTKPHVVCIEVKYSKNWDRRYEKPMLSLAGSPQIVAQRLFGVYSGSESYYFDAVEVLPVVEFLKKLHRGEVF